MLGPALALLLLASPARPAEAEAAHQLTAILHDRGEAYAQGFALPRGELAAWSGLVKSHRSGVKRMLTFNGTLSPMLAGGAKPDLFTLQYQLELGPAKDGELSPLQAQGELMLRPDGGAAAVECLDWTVYLHLDPSGDKKKAAAASKGLGNHRLKAELEGGRGKQVCRVLTRLGTQGNVRRELGTEAKPAPFLFNTILNKAGEGCQLDLQLESPGPKGNPPVRIMESLRLEAGRAKLSKGKGWKLSLLLENPK